MENKGLLKLPEIWYIKVDENNKSVLEKWFKNFYPNCIGLDNYPVVGYSSSNSNRPTKSTHSSGSFGQEISFADFKRLVLCEKNADDYGVLGCEELAVYFRHNNIEYLEGWIKENIYYILSEWDYEDFENSKRQILPLKEYLKLLPTEKTQTMEKKYEYKIKDEKYIDAVCKITNLRIGKHFFQGNDLPEFIKTLSNHNVLDLFFDRVEIVELPIINGDRIIEKGNWLHICGYDVHIDWIIKSNFKSFTLSNGIEVTEEHVKQIREYLNQ